MPAPHTEHPSAGTLGQGISGPRGVGGSTGAEVVGITGARVGGGVGAGVGVITGARVGGIVGAGVGATGAGVGAGLGASVGIGACVTGAGVGGPGIHLQTSAIKVAKKGH